VLAGDLDGRRGIIVEGELVRLRAYEPSDIAAVMKWVNDPEVTQHLEAFVAPVSRLAEERWLEAAALGADPNHRIFAIETLGGEYLGGIDLRNIAWRDRKAEQGIAIGNKSHWGKGYGTDATRVMLRFAFDVLNLKRIWMRVHEDNPRAIACYGKCGFKREGLLRQDHFARGEYRDVIIMGLLRSEFAG
jgi:RimJ/RimL family protein N-acetyltransferase